MVYTSECVGWGHPDKVCDIISDAIVEECLLQDPQSRVAIETWIKNNTVGLIGELTTSATIDYKAVVTQTLKEIGYTSNQWGIDYKDFELVTIINKQSPEIARGVDHDGAGDQGIMWGYATNQTPHYLALSQVLAQDLLLALQKSDIVGLRPDCKSQITIKDEKIDTIILAVQHDQTEIRKNVIALIKKTLGDYITDDTTIILNGTGVFHIGGPKSDAGLTGRKIIVDTYGGIGRHGGGAFSGKDPTKVDRSGAYMARYLAKNIVAHNLSTTCEIQLSYCIGKANPISIYVNTFGEQDDTKLAAFIAKTFDLSVTGIIKRLQLHSQPYKDVSKHYHFRGKYSWEALDAVEFVEYGKGSGGPKSKS